ncbi:hypothetical protein MMC25_008018 [Agyrium rufum]|nr:hypothetical protein [Agyrium rufum]
MAAAIIPKRATARAAASNPGWICSRCTFSTSAITSQEITPTSSTTPESTSLSPLDPLKYGWRRHEKRERQLGNPIIGSRRLRATRIGSGATLGIPFEQLPYQCFQEARRVLQADREEKLVQIALERERIAKAEAVDASRMRGDEGAKKGKITAMKIYLEKLKILADINDPMVKKRFEDGLGMLYLDPTALPSSSSLPNIDPTRDMDKPIYRHLADQSWRSYRRKIIMQRISQMHVVPDVIPYLDPTAEVTLSFGRRLVQAGEFVDSRVSEDPPHLNVQLFEQGEKVVTVAVVDADVPNLEKDSFDLRCHYLATNVALTPTAKGIHLPSVVAADQLVLPWLPPHALKGSPYHRLSTFILEQKPGQTMDVEGLKKKEKRAGFSLRGLITRHGLKPIGVHLFRNEWDEGTPGVMNRHGFEGVGMELKRKRPESLPYKKKDGARYR